MRFLKTSDTRGTALQIGISDNSVTAHIANIERFAPVLTPIVDSMQDFGNRVVAFDERLKPEARNDEARRSTSPLATAIKSAVGVIQAERRAQAAADVEMRTVKPGNSALRSEIRADWRGQSLDVQAARVDGASFEELAALMEGGQSVSRLPIEIWNMIDERYIVLNHVTRTGLQADFQRKPSLTDITATGPDEAAALRAARDALKRHDDRRADVAAAEESLRTIIPFIALATDERPDQVFDRLMG